MMKVLKVVVLFCVIAMLLCRTCCAFTVDVKDGQGGRSSSSPKPSPSPGTYIPSEIPPAAIAETPETGPEIVKNPMEIDMKNAKTPPAVVIDEPPPKPNNMPIILGGVAGVIIIAAGTGFFLHKKNSHQEF